MVVVSTVYPFVFLCQRDQLYLKRWYSSLGTALQCLLYAWARISSYPYVADLQHAVSVSHNTVEAVLVVTLGELTGAMCQGYLFEYALPVYAQSHSYGIKLRGGYSNLCAGNERTWIRQQYLLTRSYIDIKCVMEVGSNLVPRCCSTVIGQLSGVKGSKASRTITSASRRNPALFSALAHCSFVHVLAPYLVAFGASPLTNCLFAAQMLQNTPQPDFPKPQHTDGIVLLMQLSTAWATAGICWKEFRGRLSLDC